MNKLLFTLTPNRRMGLSFNTHTGARISLMPGQGTSISVQDNEPLTSDELLDYYNRHYGREGLKTQYLPESGLKINGSTISELPKEEAENSFKESIEDSSVPETSTETTTEAAEEISETTENASEETPSKKEIESWSFDKLKSFVNEKELTLEGRSKSDYVAAILKYFNLEG